MYKAEKRIYLNSAGQVCEEDDPDAASLLVGVGGTLTDAQARKYGLTQDAPEDAPQAQTQAEPEAPADGKAMTEPPRTKAMPAPKGSK